MQSFHITGRIIWQTYYAFLHFIKNLKNNEKQDKEIIFYISSKSTNYRLAMRMMEEIDYLIDEGYTIFTHTELEVRSAAFLIFLKADKENRTASFGTNFLFSRASGFPEPSTDEIINKTIDYITSTTAITQTEFSLYQDKVLDSNQALSLGIINRIDYTLNTFHEQENFARYFIKHSTFLFPVSKKIEDFFFEQWRHYQIGIISKNEYFNLILDYISSRRE
jgi:hypothetical protein